MNEFLSGQANILCNLPQQSRRDVSPFVKGNRCTAAIRMAKLLVGATLPYFNKSHSLKYCRDFMRFQNGNLHDLGNLNGLNANEFAFKNRLAIFE